MRPRSPTGRSGVVSRQPADARESCERWEQRIEGSSPLLHHGLSDEAILSYLARSWPLDETDCRSALDAAHILLRREQACGAGAADG